jgi:hypothetical protein
MDVAYENIFRVVRHDSSPSLLLYGFARVQAVAVAEGEDKPANDKLGAHVLRAHARHALGPFFRAEGVHKVLLPLNRREQRPLIRDVFSHASRTILAMETFFRLARSSMVLYTSGGNANSDARNLAYSSAVNVTAPNSKYSKCLSVRYAAESKTLDHAPLPKAHAALDREKKVTAGIRRSAIE